MLFTQADERPMSDNDIPTPQSGNPSRKSRTTLAIFLVAILSMGIVVGITFAAASLWTKVDEPAAEAFRKEVVLEQGDPICVVGTTLGTCFADAWDVRDLACTGKTWGGPYYTQDDFEGISRGDRKLLEGLTQESVELCEGLRQGFYDFRDVLLDDPALVSLQIDAQVERELMMWTYIETRERQVSNDEERGTNESTCYLGFIGECE